MILRINKWLANTFELVRYQIRSNLRKFSEITGNAEIVLELGSGLDSPYRKLFESNKHFGIDLFEPSDICGDVINLPFKNQSADIILCTEVLEHVPNPARVLQEINRVLVSGHHLILTVPFVFGVHDYVDYHRWTETGLIMVLEKAGFEIVELRRRGGIFSLIGQIIKQIPTQVFGEYRTQKFLLTKIIYLFSLATLYLVPWFFYPLDKLDKQRKWIVGYSVLCKKK